MRVIQIAGGTDADNHYKEDKRDHHEFDDCGTALFLLIDETFVHKS